MAQNRIPLPTSLIVQAGVDAPAMIPTVSNSLNCEKSSSPASSINITRETVSLHISARRLELALFFPPITMIQSQKDEISRASFCRLDVARHIVSKILKFVHCFFIK